MTSATPAPSHRAARTALDIVLRTAALVGWVALVPALSGESDALALGLTVFFALAALASVIALLDGMFQRDRRRLITVWGVVVPLVAVVELVDYYRTLVTGEGAYPSLQQALSDTAQDIPGSLLIYGLLVAVPAAAGICLGILIRPVAPVVTAPGQPVGVAPRG